ncbi:MAG: DUF2804 domain-containing protein [Spirochaetes bacterium]|nr:DUF2804 domain-containing protein [Spirochaetota bacterium]
MYTREIQAPRSSPIENGIPLQGTWNRAFENVNLLDVQRPYPYPLPRWVRERRIKEWESFSVQSDKIMFEAFLCDLKLFQIIQILLYNKEDGEKFSFSKLMFSRGLKLPNSLANASVICHSSRFFFRIHNWLDAGTVKLDVNIKESRYHAPLTAQLAFNLDKRDTTPMAVSLGFTERRSMYAFKTHVPVRGDIVFGKKHTKLKQNTSSGIFTDYKGFFPYRMKTIICRATGFDNEGRRFGFHIAENQTRETDADNENALWVDGKLTPLPPVRITINEGPDFQWVVQDVEGMVDLTFTPKLQNLNETRLILTSIDLNAPIGHYEGAFVSADGEQIQVRSILGVGEIFYLRV